VADGAHCWYSIQSTRMEVERMLLKFGDDEDDNSSDDEDY